MNYKKRKKIKGDSLHQFTNQSFFLLFYIVIHFYVEYLKDFIYAKKIYIFFINRENGRVEKRRGEME